MKLFLCEKPSQGQDIAKVLGVKQRADGYISSSDGKIVVTWGIGHLVEQFSPEKYDIALKRWSFDTLPIIPKTWQLEAKKNTKKQFNTVIHLIKKASHIVISTDADREGEMIARELIDIAGFKGKIERLWLSALDETSVRRALMNLKPGQDTLSLYYAGLGRSRSDWLIGMNFSRLFTLLAQQQGYQGKPLSVGRVQSPTLAMVVHRDREIAHFTPKKHYTLNVELLTPRQEKFIAYYVIPETYLDEAGLCLQPQELQKAQTDIQQLGQASLIGIETRLEKHSPPLLFSLSDLQSECNRLFGLGAQQVLDIAQSLYETHKATTYPRTDCGYLPESQFADVPNIIHNISKTIPQYQEMIANLNQAQKSRAWNDKKITAHHGIIPTVGMVNFNKMHENEKKVYDLICRRYLAQFLPVFEVAKTSISLKSGEHQLLAKGNVIKAKGWKILFNYADNEDKEDNKQTLPHLAQEDNIIVNDTQLNTLQTSPPVHYTEGTLLSAMKNAARFVTDERLKQRLRETEGLGTEATRAGLIQGLIDKGFLKKKGKSLLATDEAYALIDSLPDLLKNPGLTALWEQALNQIAEGTLNLSEFMQKQEAFIKHLMQECLHQGIKMGKIEIRKCPKCDSLMVKRTGKNGAFWGCSKYPSCDGIENIGVKKVNRNARTKKSLSISSRIGRVL